MMLSCAAAAGCSAQSSDGPLVRVNDGGLGASTALLSAQFEAALVHDGETPTDADVSGGAWRLIEVPAASNQPEIVHTPHGWFALSSRSIGDVRAPSGHETALYRSLDGVHWARVPLDPGSTELHLVGLAYGGGRYVLVGERYGSKPVTWTSVDGARWTEVRSPGSYEDVLRAVEHAGSHFFSYRWRSLQVSETGEAWRAIPTRLVQFESVTHGNGRYVVAGSGPLLTSEDGSSWQEVALDCALPGACITDPSGGVSQGHHSNVIFAEGAFYTDELKSTDGIHWEAHVGPSATAHLSGHFFGQPSLTAGLPTWVAGGDVQTLRIVRPSRAAVTATGRGMLSVGVLDRNDPIPDDVDASFEDGLTCETAACVLIAGRLFLIPPPGTPPLPDRVPRRADGAPLLSDECPFSSMITCEDYGTRTNCVCNPEAPASPASCDDVSQYRCAGQFSHRPDEWPVDEVAQGGCSCDAVDPAQPPGFGTTCDRDPSICQAPLQCLSIDPPPSIGPPLYRSMCTSPCTVDADCPSWQASGFCAGPVRLRCSNRSCQPRSCE